MALLLPAMPPNATSGPRLVLLPFKPAAAEAATEYAMAPVARTHVTSVAPAPPPLLPKAVVVLPTPPPAPPPTNVTRNQQALDKGVNVPLPLV